MLLCTFGVHIYYNRWSVRKWYLYRQGLPDNCPLIVNTEPKNSLKYNLLPHPPPKLNCPSCLDYTPLYATPVSSKPSWMTELTLVESFLKPNISTHDANFNHCFKCCKLFKVSKLTAFFYGFILLLFLLWPQTRLWSLQSLNITKSKRSTHALFPFDVLRAEYGWSIDL